MGAGANRTCAVSQLPAALDGPSRGRLPDEGVLYEEIRDDGEEIVIVVERVRDAVGELGHTRNKR